MRPLESAEDPSTKQGWIVKEGETADVIGFIDGNRSSRLGRKQKRPKLKLCLRLRKLPGVDDSEFRLGDAGEDEHHEGGTDGVGDQGEPMMG